MNKCDQDFELFLLTDEGNDIVLNFRKAWGINKDGFDSGKACSDWNNELLEKCDEAQGNGDSLPINLINKGLKEVVEKYNFEPAYEEVLRDYIYWNKFIPPKLKIRCKVGSRQLLILDRPGVTPSQMFKIKGFKKLYNSVKSYVSKAKKGSRNTPIEEKRFKAMKMALSLKKKGFSNENIATTINADLGLGYTYQDVADLRLKAKKSAFKNIADKR